MSVVKRALTFLPLFLVVLATALPGAQLGTDTDAYKFRAAFRISAGGGYALNGGGDLELQRRSIGNYFSDLRTLAGYTSTTNWKRTSLIPDFEAEVIFNLSESFQLGVGSGYIRSTSKGDYSYAYLQSGTASWGTYTYKDDVGYKRNYVLTAIPIKLTLYYTIPAGKLSFFAYAGAGFYLGSLQHTYSMNEKLFYEDFPTVYAAEKYDLTVSATGTEEGKKNAIGFHGGLGLELKLGSSLGLGLEVFGRYVNFSGWEGTLHETDTNRTRSYLEGQGWYSDTTTNDSFSLQGPIWYYEYSDPDLGKKYAYVQTFDSDPASDTVTGTRPAKLNLNTLGIRFSLKIYFNLS